MSFGITWIANAVLSLAIARIVIIQFVCNDLPRFPFFPFDVTIAVRADCVSHNVAVAFVPIRSGAPWVLAKGGRLPWL